MAVQAGADYCGAPRRAFEGGEAAGRPSVRGKAKGFSQAPWCVMEGRADETRRLATLRKTFHRKTKTAARFPGRRFKLFSEGSSKNKTAAIAGGRFGVAKLIAS
jgi:hypothetical protein